MIIYLTPECKQKTKLLYSIQWEAKATCPPEREAPSGKLRGIFAEPSDLSSKAIRAKGEAKDTIFPYGSLLRRSSAGYGGREPQGFLAKEGEHILPFIRGRSTRDNHLAVFNIDDGDDGAARAGLIHRVAAAILERKALAVGIDCQRVRIFTAVNIDVVTSGARIVCHRVGPGATVSLNMIVAGTGIYSQLVVSSSAIYIDMIVAFSASGCYVIIPGTTI